MSCKDFKPLDECDNRRPRPAGHDQVARANGATRVTGNRGGQAGHANDASRGLRDRGFSLPVFTAGEQVASLLYRFSPAPAERKVTKYCVRKRVADVILVPKHELHGVSACVGSLR
jgi:hypothetical protein